MLGQHLLIAAGQPDQFTAHIGVVENKALGEVGHIGSPADGCKTDQGLHPLDWGPAILGANAAPTKPQAIEWKTLDN
ncbi:hypothetical protein Pstr01_42520 [Pseudomonas straminea]|nr:hypothetical protein Pstr01_42520 [Pseudomonas straminea]